MPFDLKTKAMSAPNFGPQILAKVGGEGGVVKAGEEEDLVALPFLEAFSSAYKVVLSSQRMDIGK